MLNKSLLIMGIGFVLCVCAHAQKDVKPLPPPSVQAYDEKLKLVRSDNLDFTIMYREENDRYYVMPKKPPLRVLRIRLTL
jgi:hypothetical protein